MAPASADALRFSAARLSTRRYWNQLVPIGEKRLLLCSGTNYIPFDLGEARVATFSAQYLIDYRSLCTLGLGICAISAGPNHRPRNAGVRTRFNQ